jgi:hypothetical protein
MLRKYRPGAAVDANGGTVLVPDAADLAAETDPASMHGQQRPSYTHHEQETRNKKSETA